MRSLVNHSALQLVKPHSSFPTPTVWALTNGTPLTSGLHWLLNHTLWPSKLMTTDVVTSYVCCRLQKSPSSSRRIAWSDSRTRAKVWHIYLYTIYNFLPSWFPPNGRAVLLAVLLRLEEERRERWKRGRETYVAILFHSHSWICHCWQCNSGNSIGSNTDFDFLSSKFKFTIQQEPWSTAELFNINLVSAIQIWRRVIIWQETIDFARVI